MDRDIVLDISEQNYFLFFFNSKIFRATRLVLDALLLDFRCRAGTRLHRVSYCRAPGRFSPECHAGAMSNFLHVPLTSEAM